MINYPNYLQFEKLNEFADIGHLFTKKPYNFNKNLVPTDQISKQYQEIVDLLAINFKNIISLQQTHSNNVVIIDEENLDKTFIDTDGAITNLKNVALTIKVADCQALMFYDPINKVIANIHSGWKGTLNKITRKTVNMMTDHFNCDPKNILVFICPSILDCCFEVDIDVKEQFVSNFKYDKSYIKKGSIKEGKQKYFIDTVKLNILELESLNILKEHIYTSNICTKCHHENFHSYRFDKDKSGRNLALICLK